jgi:hypothetical protein
MTIQPTQSTILRTHFLPIVLLFLVVHPMSVWAQAWDNAGWQWQAPIRVPSTSGDFVRLNLNLEVVDKARSTLSDLRIVDDEGALVPHIVHRDRPEPPKEVWQTAGLINNSYEEGESTQVTIPFGNREQRNSLRVTLSGDNYRRYALL